MSRESFLYWAADTVATERRVKGYLTGGEPPESARFIRGYSARVETWNEEARTFGPLDSIWART